MYAVIRSAGTISPQALRSARSAAGHPEADDSIHLRKASLCLLYGCDIRLKTAGL